MKWLRRLLAGLGVLIVLAVVALVFTLRYTADCPDTPPPPAGKTLMTAMVHRCYGGPGVLHTEHVPRPELNSDEVLVHVRAMSLNPLDFHYMRGTPYVVRLGEGFGRPADPQIGVDFAGTVEAVGAAVTHFKIGDEVFGGRFGAFAEYVKVKESRGITLKPAEASFEQAAAVPIAGVTALQGLRDAGQLRAGQKVLVNGASGGVGTFAVQIAKSYGAKVTGVCSARNAQLVRSLGAEEVIDYAQGDFTQGTVRYDLIFDTVGTHSLADYARVLTPAGRVIIVGNAHLGDWLSAFITPLEGVVRSKFSRQQFLPVFAELTQADLTALASLMHSHQLISVIDRTLPFAQLPEGMRYLEAGHAHGKVIIEAP